MKPNPPVEGHHLLFEGHSHARYNASGEPITAIGGCECGDKPPGWPDLSARKVKEWHRDHKNDIRLWLGRPRSTVTIVNCADCGLEIEQIRWGDKLQWAEKSGGAPRTLKFYCRTTTDEQGGVLTADFHHAPGEEQEHFEGEGHIMTVRVTDTTEGEEPGITPGSF